MRIIHPVGAGPNFMEDAPVMRALKRVDGVAHTPLHTTR